MLTVEDIKDQIKERIESFSNGCSTDGLNIGEEFAILEHFRISRITLSYLLKWIEENEKR